MNFVTKFNVLDEVMWHGWPYGLPDGHGKIYGVSVGASICLKKDFVNRQEVFSLHGEVGSAEPLYNILMEDGRKNQLYESQLIAYDKQVFLSPEWINHGK